MIQETSLEAYIGIQSELGCRQQQILDIISKYDGVSNLDISRIVGLAINCVTPRVKELRDYGLVVFSHSKLDRITGRRVMCWKVKE